MAEPPRKKRRKEGRDPTGALMQTYEQAFERYLDPSKPWIVRLDGHNFGNMMRGMRQPYDDRYLDSMSATGSDLLEEFHPTLVYTQSDEISMVFPRATVNARGNRTELIYNGQLQKIVSLSASYAAARFNHHIAKQTFAVNESELCERLTSGRLSFDGRAFNLPDDETALRNILWRGNFDCRRNSIAALGSCHLKKSMMHRSSTNEILMMLAAKGIQWTDMPDYFKYGRLLKKERFTREGTDPRSGQQVDVLRMRVASRSFLLPTNVLRGIPLLFVKYWDEYDAAVVVASSHPPASSSSAAAHVDEHGGDDDEGEKEGEEEIPLMDPGSASVSEPSS